LSICLRNRARLQICWSVSVAFHDGIPVHRMPCLIFQKEKPSGSSSTPSAASCGGRGYRPLATGEADGSPFAVPWQIARKLVADLFSEGIEAIVPTTVRETVDAVARMKCRSANSRPSSGWTKASPVVGFDKRLSGLFGQSGNSQWSPRPNRAGRSHAGRGAGIT